MNRLINIHLVALLLFAAMSCSKDESVRVAPSGEEITFSDAQTRATASTASDIGEFGVYAVMSLAPDANYQQPSDVEYIHILEDERVYKSGSDYTYTNTAYWFDQRTFHFFGYWPYGTTSRIASDGVSYELDFEVAKADTPAEQTAADDLLTFHYSTAYVQGNTTTVDVNFTHILSKITFSISQDFAKNPYDRFHVNSVSLTPIKAGGTYTTSRYNQVGEWHYSDSRLIFSFAPGPEDPKPQFTPDPPGTNNLVIFDGLKLVPQKIESGTIGLVVKYTYEQGNGSTPPVYSAPVEKTASTFLPIGEWKPGKAYHYKMSLYQDNLIVFKNIDITPWGEQPDAGTIIIK